MHPCPAIVTVTLAHTAFVFCLFCAFSSLQLSCSPPQDSPVYYTVAQCWAPLLGRATQLRREPRPVGLHRARLQPRRELRVLRRPRLRPTRPSPLPNNLPGPETGTAGRMRRAQLGRAPCRVFSG